MVKTWRDILFDRAASRETFYTASEIPKVHKADKQIQKITDVKSKVRELKKQLKEAEARKEKLIKDGEAMIACKREIDRDVNKRIKAWGREMAARDDDVLGCSSSDNDTEDEEFMEALELALTPTKAGSSS